MHKLNLLQILENKKSFYIKEGEIFCLLSKAVNGWVSFLLQTTRVTSHAVKGGWGTLRIFPYWVSAFLQLQEWPLHAYVIDRTSLLLSSFTTEEVIDPVINLAINRTSLLLSSFTIDGATDPAIDLVIDHTSLLLSSFATDGAIDAVLKPAIDPALDRIGTALERIDSVLNILMTWYPLTKKTIDSLDDLWEKKITGIIFLLICFCLNGL